MLICPVIRRPTLIDLTANCIAHYKMNDDAATTNVIDSMLFSDGTAEQNTEDINTDGQVNGALTFDKTVPDGINLNNGFLSVLQNNFSFALWAKPNDGQPVGTQYFIAKIKPEGTAYIQLNADGTITASYSIYGIGALTYYSDVIFNNGVEDWHFLVMTVEQLTPTTGKLSFYFDGQFKGSSTGDMVMSSFGNNENLSLGILDLSNPFDGAIDNVMIFDKALTPAEVAFLWNNGQGRETLA